jgi:fumarylacetoacetate (FAA) hydrolase family protein
VFDLSDRFATLSDLLESDSPLSAVRQTPGTFIASVEALLANTGPDADPTRPYLLPPLDLQVIKAAGVTFAASMIERVIEEQAGGDAARPKPFAPPCMGSSVTTCVRSSPAPSRPCV